MVTVWCVFLQKDVENNLVKEGRAVKFDVKPGVMVDDLAKKLFPEYNLKALGRVGIYLSSDYPSDETDNDNQWTEVAGSERLQASQDNGQEHFKKIVYGILDPLGDHEQSRPLKRRKIRDSRNDTEVHSNKFIDLDTCAVKILTVTGADPHAAVSGNTVRYYGRSGMSDIFVQLIDKRENQTNFNIEFIGPPGTGKSNLVWAAAEYLATNMAVDVLWVGRRSTSEDWTVIQFRDEGVFSFEDVPSNLSDVLKSQAFAKTSVLIIDAPISIDDETERQQGASAYAWASKTGFHRSRIGCRRVIHVSSLGASTDKGEQRRQLSIQELSIPPWTRQDFIKAVADSQLKKKVCQTMNISDPSSIGHEDLVDLKFFYSGINARWFFNLDIATIKEECHLIVSRLTSSSVSKGDRNREAVNSALQRYWLGDRSVVLFTSSYLAKFIGMSQQTQGQKQFLENYPLIKDYLGNGAPGEIFEADFAIHLQQCHDLADAHRAVMGDKAQQVGVVLGTTSDSVTTWPTGKLYKLPSVSNREVSFQKLPEEAIEDLSQRVAQWFIPESNSQPFLDFFVLVPEGEEKWQFVQHRTLWARHILLIWSN